MAVAEMAFGGAQHVPTAAPTPAPLHQWLAAFLDEEELLAEDANQRKRVYLVTLPHPRGSVMRVDDFAWRPPGAFSREQVGVKTATKGTIQVAALSPGVVKRFP